MQLKTLTSIIPVTFLDYTDNRKLDIYITSNLPQMQIYNPNSKGCSPDWSATPLRLTAKIFLDSEDITDQIAPDAIVWHKRDSMGVVSGLNTTGKVLEISQNAMSQSTPFVTYICSASYGTNLDASAEIAFTHIESGQKGADGTSVNIKDTAYCDVTLGDEHIGEIVSLYLETSDNTIDISTLSNGDAYIVQGYLCICNKEKNGFICTGKIQGPQGADAKSIKLNATTQMFSIDINNVITPSEITIVGQAINTQIIEWQYSTNGGTYVAFNGAVDWMSKDGNTLKIIGNKLPSDAHTITIKALGGECSDICTVYKALPGESAPIVFLDNENITFSANNQGQIINTKPYSSNIIAYRGTDKIRPIISQITDVPEGLSVVPIDMEEAVMLTIIPDSNATLGSEESLTGTILVHITEPIPIVLSLSWSKINTGATGASGVDAVTFKVYSADGYVLSKETPFIQLKTFAYNGDVPINAEATALYEGATFKWYETSKTSQTEAEWVELTEEKIEEVVDENTGETTTITYREPATSPYVTIHHKEVSFSASYMCKMTFNGMEYVDVVTIDDKNDTNTIFTSKPTAYSEGDIWIVGHDGAPNGIEIGTVLKAQHTNSTYSDSDWVVGTKYDDKLTELETTVGKYRQYISLDTDAGITMNAVNADGKVSEFSTSLSNTELAFKQGDEKVAYINNHKMHITEAEIESPLTVTGRKDNDGDMIQAPTINLGNFSFVIESNGSLSMVSNL